MRKVWIFVVFVVGGRLFLLRPKMESPDSTVLEAPQKLRQAMQRMWTEQWRKREIFTR